MEFHDIAYICACCGAPTEGVVKGALLDSGTTLTCDECGGDTVLDLRKTMAYVITSDDAVREFDRQFNAILENVDWMTKLAKMPEARKGRLRKLLDALTDLCTQWNVTITRGEANADPRI